MANSFFENLLGGVTNLTGGQSASDLTGKAKSAWNNQSTLTKGAIAGGLLGVLLSGNARRMVGTGVKVGGAALIGGLAYKAYEDWKAGKVANPDVAATFPEPTEEFLPADDVAAEDLSRRLLQAMIAAAKADGQVTNEERARITDNLPNLGLGAEAQDMLTAELDAPLDIGAVAALATTPEEGAQIYAASLLAINPEGPAEKGYLAMLAARLSLDAGLVSHLHARAANLA